MRESNKVWQPSESRIAEANITQFIEHINRQGFDLKTTQTCTNGLWIITSSFGKRSGCFAM